MPHSQANRDIRSIEIERICLDGETQHRAALEPEVISEYASLMKEGVSFPAVTVWLDEETYCRCQVSGVNSLPTSGVGVMIAVT
jgi:hypothetical protein